MRGRLRLCYHRRHCHGRKDCPMATIDTVKDVLQENLDIDPAEVDEASTFYSLGIDSL
ncbi:MAG: acyl carrier protein, partial [Eggerthellaceae bacterium]